MGEVVSLFDCQLMGLGFKCRKDRTNMCPLANSAIKSKLTVHCQREG